MRDACPEPLHEVNRPERLAGFLREAYQRPVRGQRIQPVAIESRRAAWPMPALLAEGLAGWRLPNFLAGLGIDSQHELLFAALPLREQQSARDGKRRVPFTEPLRLPHQRRTVGGPGFQQPSFRGNAIALNAAPLRPVGREQWQSQQKKPGFHMAIVPPPCPFSLRSAVHPNVRPNRIPPTVHRNLRPIVYLRSCIQTCVHNSLGFRARSNGAVTVRERFSEPQWISPCVSKRVGVSHGPERQPPSFSGDFIRTTCILQSQVIKIFIIFSAPITYWQTQTPAPLFF